MERKNAWPNYTEEQRTALNTLCEEYKDFITRAKTERECVALAEQMAEAAGYCRLEDVIDRLQLESWKKFRFFCFTVYHRHSAVTSEFISSVFRNSYKNRSRRLSEPVPPPPAKIILSCPALGLS